MPNLTQLETACNSLITSVFNKLTSQQPNYLLNRGQYWQGVTTHTVVPSHTTSKWGDAIPDALTIHPHDQYEDWIATLPDMVSVATPCAFRVDVYDGQSGKGYELIAIFNFNGTRYERHLNVGPETYREQAWSAMT